MSDENNIPKWQISQTFPGRDMGFFMVKNDICQERNGEDFIPIR